MMQNENRESFVFYRSFLGAIREMEAADQLAMFRAVCEYALEGKEPPLTSAIQRAVFAVIRPSVDTNIARREGGKRGGRPTAKTGKAAVSKPETMGFEDKPFPEQGFSPENHGAQRFSKPENTETESEAEAETEAESETETAAEFKDAGSRREISRREISSRTGALIGPDAVAGQEGNSRSGQESSLTGSAPEETSPGGVIGSIPEGIIRDCGQEINSRQEGGSRKTGPDAVAGQGAKGFCRPTGTNKKPAPIPAYLSRSCLERVIGIEQRTVTYSNRTEYKKVRMNDCLLVRL